MHRLRDDAAARGYQVVAEVTEIASGLTDARPKRKKLLTDARVGVLVVEHRDRLPRLGSGYLTTLLEPEGRRVEGVFPTETGDDLVDDLVDDFVAVITSLAARIYGRRHAKRRAAQIQAGVKRCVKRCVEQAKES